MNYSLLLEQCWLPVLFIFLPVDVRVDRHTPSWYPFVLGQQSTRVTSRVRPGWARKQRARLPITLLALFSKRKVNYHASSFISHLMSCLSIFSFLIYH